MLTKQILIKNVSGLHMRPAGVFVKEAQKFKSKVGFSFKDGLYDAKSMINVLSATVKCGDEIELMIDGADEVECLEAVTALIEGGLGE